MTVLVVAAHPDDEVLGAGATMARLAAQGRGVAVLLLGEGATSRVENRAEADRSQVGALIASSRRAAEILGVTAPVHGGLPDNRFDSVDLLDVVKLIEAEVERVEPSLVLTHHCGDLNVDHQITARATLAATRPQPGHCVRTVMSFEVASATEWSFGAIEPPFEPTVFVDVTETLDRKLEALRAYEQELRPFPHPRSIEGIISLARTRGATAGVDAAEAFRLLRSVR